MIQGYAWTVTVEIIGANFILYYINHFWSDIAINFKLFVDICVWKICIST